LAQEGREALRRELEEQHKKDREQWEGMWRAQTDKAIADVRDQFLQEKVSCYPLYTPPPYVLMVYSWNGRGRCRGVRRR
jgi:hypothetical protein